MSQCCHCTARIGSRMPNNCVQATADCALLFIVAHVPGAPDAERWARQELSL